MRGFSRIGGVLIGRDPEQGGAADFRDIRWQHRDGRLHVTLVRSDGRELPAGSFHPSIVGQALAYAADGRAVTVTMVKANPLPDLKILTHPALVDTPLGCRAIELDRFVDKYVSTRTSDGRFTDRALASLRVSIHRVIYDFAWAVRFLTAIEQMNARDELEARAPGFLEGVKRRRDARALQLVSKDNTGKTLISYAASVGDTSLSPLGAKPEYYDASLVSAITTCATSDITAFDECIAKTAGVNDGKRLFAMPPDFDLWSGVRERPYRVDHELAFLRPDGEARLWPFDFMLQVAFTSSPEFASGNDEEYADETPWEFPELKEAVPGGVASGVAGDRTDSEILRAMQDFAVAQRLFRAALGGHLGASFPLEKLVQLGRDTRAAVRVSQTLRWQPQRVEVEPRDAEDVSRLREKLGVLEDARRAFATSCGPL